MKQNISLLAIVASLTSACKACFIEHIARAADAAAAANARNCVNTAAPATGTFTIKNVRVFDGNGFGIPEAVLVTGSKIALVGGAAIPGIPTVDGTGKFLIPGFVESHVHPQTCDDLSVLSGYGITTAINMACLNYTQCASLKDQIGTTDYVTAGEIACGSGSIHAIALGVPPQDTINAGTNLGALVGYTLGNGSDFFKIIAEPGGPTTEQQTTLVQLTHQRGKMAATHATLLDNYEQAIESKVDSIQHTPADGLLSNAQISKIHSQGQFVTRQWNFTRSCLPTQRCHELSASRRPAATPTSKQMLPTCTTPAFPLLLGQML